MRHAVKLAALCALAASLASCGDGPTNPSAASRMESVSGNAQPGFAGIPLDERIVVRVLDVNDVPVPGVQVSWVVTAGGGSVTPAQSQSDDNGIARTTWTLGVTGGAQQVTANIAGLTSIEFTATAQQIGETCSGTPLNLAVGGAVVLVGPQAAQLCLGGDAFSTRDFVAVAFNSARGQSGGGSVSYGISGTGTIAAAGPPSPNLADAQAAGVFAGLQAATAGSQATRRNDAFDATLREKERSGLAPRVLNRALAVSRENPRMPGAAYSLANPVVGETIVLNANSDDLCTLPINRNGRVAAVTQHAIVIEDTGNPAGGFTAADYQSLGRTFDTLVHPVDIENFGEPHDIDRNNRIVLFYTAEVNKLTDPGAPLGFVAGFFFARDLFPKTGNARLEGCPSSNQAEMMYLMVPDPTGIHGNAWSKSFVRERTTATLAHEMQHLINSSRRLYINTSASFPEDGWLEEGISHIAEELLFFKAAGLQTGQNLTTPMIQAQPDAVLAFNEFQSENLARIQGFLASTNINWPFRTSSPDLNTRGAATWFLRYTVDRLGGNQTDTWQSLVNSNDTGFENLEGVIHADPMQWMRDWAVALYVDDVVAGVPGRYRIQSWNLRSIVSGTGAGATYRLQTISLPNGTVRNANLQPAGSLHYRFGTPIGGQARLNVTSVPTIPTTLGIVVVRTR